MALAESETLKRRPPPPEQLVGALHDPIHEDIGRSRPARVRRSAREHRHIIDSAPKR